MARARSCASRMRGAARRGRSSEPSRGDTSSDRISSASLPHAHSRASLAKRNAAPARRPTVSRPWRAPMHADPIPDMSRVVITGLGPITAAGISAGGLWEGLRRERSPIRRVTRFDTSPWRSKIAAEVDDFEPTDYMDAKLARRLDRFCHFSIAATRLALADASLDTSRIELDRVAVQMGSALGGSANAEVQAATLYSGDVRSVDPRVALTTFV